MSNRPESIENQDFQRLWDGFEPRPWFCNSLAKLGFIIVEAEVFSHLRLAVLGVGVSGWKERSSDWWRSGGIGS